MLMLIFLIPGFGKLLAAQLRRIKKIPKIFDNRANFVSVTLSSQLGKLGKIYRTIHLIPDFGKCLLLGRAESSKIKKY